MQIIGAQLEIRLFGHAGVNAAGVPVKFAKRATTLAMLALIVLQRGKVIARESLAFTLFPEFEEQAALRELRRYLYLASKSLPPAVGDPWLIADAETVRWNDAADAFVDVIAFERFSSDPQTQPQAIDLYAGDLLENIYDDWVLAERERLRTRYLAVLGESLDRHRSRREFVAATACAKRILTCDPWREDTLRSLLAIRYESGDTAGALAEYEQFAKRLRGELAIGPMPETVAVRASILRNEPVPGALEAGPGPTPGERPKAIAVLPFVGRRRELASLHAAWSRAARGAGALVIVSGEAGVGKTRLTAELSRIVQTEGGRVFVGTTAAPESTPYQAIVEALRSGLPLLLARPPAAARRAALARLLPELREPAMPALELPQQPADRETARIFDALATAIRSLGSPRPLLLILEDLQWAGSASVDALDAIVRELTHAPILIVATAREEEARADHPLRALQRSLRVFRNVEEIVLGRLGQEDVAELVTRVDDLPDRSDALVRDLYAHSEGNALFLNEAISGVIERRETLPTAATNSIARVIAARIARLGDEARAVAEIAAVAGAGCSVALIREVANVPAAQVARGLDELLDRRIVREASARTSHDYVFTHHLIAQAIYGEIDLGFRAQRHSRIARFLELEHRETRASSAREVARHYEAAGDCARSALWYLQSAREAAAVHAYGDAIDLADRALANSPSIELQIASLDIRERAHGRRGDRTRQRADIDELERLAGDDARARFDVLTRRVLLARALGETEEEGRLIGELGSIADTLDDTARAQALAQRATHLGLRSRHGEALAPALAALAIYERLGDPPGQLECLFLLVDYTANLGDVTASRDYLRRMRERVASGADQIVEARALAAASTAALLRGENRECIELATQALALQVATNDREGEAYSRGRLAAASARLDDFGTALREFERTLETYASIGHKRGVALTYTNRTMLLMRLGLFDDALRSIERSNAVLEIVQEQRMIVCNNVNASFVKLQLGDAEAAKAFAQLGLAGAREIGFPVFEAAALANLGNAERSLGEVDSAIEHMEAGVAIRRPMQEARDYVDDLADLTLSYVAAGRVQAAAATAEELCAIGTSSFDGAFWAHYIWWAIAAGLGAAGLTERARDAVCRAGVELDRFAARIDDDRTRTAFLAIPANARIAAEARAASAPKIAARS